VHAECIIPDNQTKSNNNCNVLQCAVIINFTVAWQVTGVHPLLVLHAESIIPANYAIKQQHQHLRCCWAYHWCASSSGAC